MGLFEEDSAEASLKGLPNVESVTIGIRYKKVIGII
jgi:hypothetical protein